MSEEIEKQGYKILQSVPNEEIDLLIHGGPIQRKIDLYLIIMNDKELPIYISAKYEDSLFWGIYEDMGSKKVPEIYKKAIEKMVDKYEKKDNWLYRKDLSSNNGDDIRLSNFSEGNTFNLISPKYRSKIIEKIVSEINRFIMELEQIKSTMSS